MPVLALGAPHTTSTTPRAGVDLAYLQLVGIGMALGLDHAGDGEGRELRRRVVDALDVEPHGGELLGQLRERRRGLQMILEPGEGDLHASRSASLGPAGALQRRRQSLPLRGGVRGGGNARTSLSVHSVTIATAASSTAMPSPDLHPTPSPSPSRGGDTVAAIVTATARRPASARRGRRSRSGGASAGRRRTCRAGRGCRISAW